MKKLLYLDGNKEKVLKGEILSEDVDFVTFECDLNRYRINKKQILSIKEKVGDIENGNGKRYI